MVVVDVVIVVVEIAILAYFLETSITIEVANCNTLPILFSPCVFFDWKL